MHLPRHAALLACGLMVIALVAVLYQRPPEAPSEPPYATPRTPQTGSTRDPDLGNRQTIADKQSLPTPGHPSVRSEPPDLLPPSHPVVKHCLRVMRKEAELYERKVANSLELAERIDSDTDVVAQYLAMWELDRWRLERLLRTEAMALVQRRGMIPIEGKTDSMQMLRDDLAYQLEYSWMPAKQSVITGAIVPFHDSIASVDHARSAKEEWSRALASLYADEFNGRDAVFRATLIQNHDWRSEAPGASQAYLERVPGQNLLRVKVK